MGHMHHIPPPKALGPTLKREQRDVRVRGSWWLLWTRIFWIWQGRSTPTRWNSKKIIQTYKTTHMMQTHNKCPWCIIGIWRCLPLEKEAKNRAGSMSVYNVLFLKRTEQVKERKKYGRVWMLAKLWWWAWGCLQWVSSYVWCVGNI